MTIRPKNHDWLALTSEEALEPELPICDPHHHLWDKRPARIAERYLLDEILEDVGAGHNVVSTVFIECGAMYRADADEALRPVGETEFVNGIAAMSASNEYGAVRIAAGIVGRANLCLGDGVATVLDAHLEAGGGRFRGIRHIAAWYPDTTLILNHFGGPLGVGGYAGQSDQVYADWRVAIAELARCPNVVAKLGGINMEVNGFGWHEKPRPPSSQELVDATRRYYEFTFEQFGVDRCLFESNFPVDKVSCSYTVLWNSFKRLTASYSASEKAKLYHDTAARVYRLQPAREPVAA